MDHLATKTDVEVAFARLETQIDAVIARLETEMRRMTVVVLIGQAVIPPVVERLLEKL